MQFVLGALSAPVIYWAYKKYTQCSEEQKFSWSQCDLPNGYHVTISFYGKQSLDYVVDRHRKLTSLFKKAPIVFTGNEFKWYGKNKDIGVVELTCDSTYINLMQMHYNKHATKDHGDVLKLHITLHEGDDPKDFIGKTFTSNSISSWYGKTFITSPLSTPLKANKLMKTE